MVLLLVGEDRSKRRVHDASSFAFGWTHRAYKSILKMSPMPSAPVDSTNRVSGSTQAAALGELLFFDTSLSANGQVACATCHDSKRSFTDGQRVSVALGTGSRNAPTIIDSAHQRWLTWDGRADSLWGQALHPFISPVEMGLTRSEVITLVGKSDPLSRGYREVFGRSIQDEPIDHAFANIGKAIAAYERTIVSSPGMFDDYVDALRRGDARAVEQYPESARRGLVLFVGRAGCVRCHHGPFLTDGEFHLVGVPDAKGQLPRDVGRLQGIDVLLADPFNTSGIHSDDPQGEQARITRSLIRQPEMWGAVRTPSLRQAAKTAPYMHAGQFATLLEVVHFYNTLEGAAALDHHAERMLAPLRLTSQEETDLVAFLESLAPSK